MIKLGRLRVENFKSFLHHETFLLSAGDIVLLDGPNGFGKTTIFDAIELCFREEINRIINTDNKSKNNHILKNDASKETNIFLELIDNLKTKCVIQIHIPANTSNIENKSNSCKVKRRFLNLWPSDFSNVESCTLPLDKFSLESVIGNAQLKNTFNVFNYIQQEETCHFLKQKESNRHQLLSYLFGTIKESAERDKLVRVQEHLKLKLNSVSDEIKESNEQLETLQRNNSQLFDRFKGSEIKSSGKIPKLNNLTAFNLDLLNTYSTHLNNVNWLLGNSSVYSNILFNHQIYVLTNQRKQELLDLISVGSTTDYSEITKLDKHIRWIVNLESKMNNLQSLISSFKNNPVNVLKGNYSEFFKYYLEDIKVAQPKIDTYINLTNQIGTYESILNTILSSRSKLFDDYNTHVNSHEGKEKEKIKCPLCGLKKDSLIQLLGEYDKQSETFKGLLSDKSKEINTLYNDLVDNTISPIVLSAEFFIGKYKKYLQLKNVISSRQISKDRWDNMNRVKRWLSYHNLDYFKFIQPDILRLNKVADSERYIEIIKLIRDSSVSVNSNYNYQLINDSLNLFGFTFKNNSIKNTEKIEVSLTDIEHDLDFIGYTKSQKLSSENKKLESKVEKKVLQSLAITVELDKIKEIVLVYRNKIKEYEKKVTQKIAIPFYVYSSKVLQTRPEGNGVFLQTPETSRENGYIRFASTARDDHDAWNMMSSGQLSGIIISFMLAMNKVYPSNLASLLIDDPVQTMDEINMASFVQLLQYEFPDKQLILSTHEKKVSDYLNFKYSQSDLKINSINLKNRKLGL